VLGRGMTSVRERYGKCQGGENEIKYNPGQLSYMTRRFSLSFNGMDTKFIPVVSSLYPLNDCDICNLFMRLSNLLFLYSTIHSNEIKVKHILLIMKSS
jgi:hypothetical protein